MVRTVATICLLATVALVSAACAPSGMPSAPTSGEVSQDPLAGRWIGYYVPEVPTDTVALSALERSTGQPATVSHYFLGVAVEPFNPVMAHNAAAHGSVPMITLEFWDYRRRTAEQPEFRLDSIASGSHDAYLRAFARDARAFGRLVLLRPLHEMNGSWYPWAGTVNGNEPGDFRAAWQHVRDVFAEEGADNVRFVWCPNAQSVPGTPENSIAAYWPGDEHVDYVALDGYNGADPQQWRDFGEVFGRGYRELTRLTDKPLIIAETACAESHGKPEWTAAMFHTLSDEFTGVSGIVWFNEHKEHDWRIESSPESVRAFRDGAANWISASP